MSMPEYQQRVITEKSELEVKVNALSDFLNGLENGTITSEVTDEHKDLLNTQLLHMVGYMVALSKRIKLFGEVVAEEPVVAIEEGTPDVG